MFLRNDGYFQRTTRPYITKNTKNRTLQALQLHFFYKCRGDCGASNLWRRLCHVLPPTNIAKEKHRAVHKDTFFDVIEMAVTLGRGNDVRVRSWVYGIVMCSCGRCEWSGVYCT
jgi:hypothetical protein